MPDVPNDQPLQEPDTSQVLSQARQALDAIISAKDQAELHLKQTEVFRKNADSEALLAFNAKKACEEHATAISSLKGVVEADTNAIATNKQRADEALAALTTAKATVDGDVKAIDGRRKEVDQASITVDQAVGSISKATESGVSQIKDIEVLKESADSQSRAAAESARAATRSAADAASAQTRAEQSNVEAAAIVAAMSNEHKTTSETVTETQALLAQAKAAEENLKKVLDHLSKSDDIASGHEKRVEALSAKVQELNDRVEGLLPGATSAGLASSFNKQRSRFQGPQRQWLATFISCIAALVLLAVPSFLSAIGWTHSSDQSWSAAWRSVTLRLPILFPVIWLAIYAGRNYMMSLRMEEDYAYKEAISTAFEGYKREMEKIAASDGENPTPLTTLCTNILRAISERPGRIYEGRQKDINLMTEVQELVEKSADLSKKQLAKH